MKQGLIYRVTNKINGKVYIGKTKRTLEERKNEHFKIHIKTKYSSLFYRSILKYGWDNFNWDILDVVDLDCINKREEELISQYGTLNIAGGGNGGDTISKHPFRDNIIAKLKTRTQQRGKDSPGYKPITFEIRNRIIALWNEMTIKCLTHLAIEANINSYICKRTLLEEGYTIPLKYITQQKLIQAGINAPSRRLKFNKGDIEKIIYLYTKELIASNKIASIMGIKSGDAIIKILKNNNIQIRTKSEDTTINNLRRSKNGKYKQI